MEYKKLDVCKMIETTQDKNWIYLVEGPYYMAASKRTEPWLDLVVYKASQAIDYESGEKYVEVFFPNWELV